MRKIYTTPALKPDKIRSDRLVVKEKKKELKNEKSDKAKNIDGVIQYINKQYGQGAIMKLGSKACVDIEVVPTGILPLDIIMGVGGIPKGRIAEIYGPESSGKTTLALHIVSEVQKAGGLAAFIDVEHAMDPSYAKKLGVDTANLLISQPSYGEEALDITEVLVKSNACDIIVIDSVAALVPKAEIEGNMGDTIIGLQARLMSHALRKLTGAISKSKCIVLFINQIREKIGVMFGNPETTPGGRALKFYASMRIEIRKSTALRKGDLIYGNLCNIKLVKNKVAPPFKKCQVDMIYGKGISRMGGLVDTAVDMDFIQKSGSWYSYGDTRLGQGKDKVVEFFEENKEMSQEIYDKVMQKIKE